jgi:hypothetical protein
VSAISSLGFHCIPGITKTTSLSATHLTDLRLSHSGYISPEAIVSCFSTLTRLETLILEFAYHESEHRRPPPPTRTLLPALTRLQFYGVKEYLEDLVRRIDAPQLDNLKISLFYKLIRVDDTAQLAQFINRTPKLKALNEAHVVFHRPGVIFTLRRVFENGPGISHEVVDFLLSSVAQVCTLSLSQASSAAVERLYIYDNYEWWREDIQVKKYYWLELLRPFTSVKSLYLSRVNVRRIAPALQALIEERVAGVLPALQTLFLEDLGLSGPVQKAIGSFVSGRQFSGHPVAVSHWERKCSD